MRTYWHIELRCDNAREQSWILFDVGAIGIEELDEHFIRVSFYGEKNEVHAFVQSAKLAGFAYRCAAEVVQQNWVSQCSQVFEKVQVGNLLIEPISSPQQLPKEKPREALYLIPGLGFGTGHHPSTQQSLDLLQRRAIPQLPPRKILDFGCGSGILSIACAKLFDADILAIDIAEDALANAIENATLNSCRRNITFSKSFCITSQEKFDLICANIYAEVLEENRQKLIASLRPGGMIITAGIMGSLAANFEGVFGSELTLIEKLETPEWYAFLFQKEI